MENSGLTILNKCAAAQPLPTDARSRCAWQACPIAVQGGRVRPCQVICKFSLKGDCGKLFEQRCDKNLHMQLHAAALHFHCLSTPLLLTNILEGAWLSRERSLMQRRCWLTFSRKRLLQPGREGQRQRLRPWNPAVDVPRKLSNERFLRICQLLSRISAFYGAK